MSLRDRAKQFGAARRHTLPIPEDRLLLAIEIATVLAAAFIGIKAVLP